MFMDSVADLICKLNNANRAHLATVNVQSSKMLVAILEIMLKEGYIASYQQKKDKNNKETIIINLKYKGQIPVINGLKQISKPGLRVYTSAKTMPKILNGLGIAIISTSHGIMTSKLEKKDNLGGEVIAYVW